MLVGIGLTDLTFRTSQVALPLVVLSTTGSAAATGLVGGASGIPVVLSPWWTRRLRHRVHYLAIMAHCYELRGGGGIVIPQVVMDHLEMPEAFSRACIESQQRITEQVRTGAIRAVKVIFRAGGRYIDNAALLIDRHIAPDIDSRTLLPAVATPGVVACLSWTGH